MRRVGSVLTDAEPVGSKSELETCTVAHAATDRRLLFRALVDRERQRWSWPTPAGLTSRKSVLGWWKRRWGRQERPLVFGAVDLLGDIGGRQIGSQEGTGTGHAQVQLG